MKKLLLSLTVALFLVPATQADTIWVLANSKLTYQVSHPMHHVAGTSTAAKGKGICSQKGCDFLIAAPINTFDSNDSNRDSHMLQAVKGGSNPLVSVQTHLSTEPTLPEAKATLTVDLAGVKVEYPDVQITVLEKSATKMHVKGIIPLVLTRHKIDRPSLLGVAIKDNTPVEFDATWEKK